MTFSRRITSLQKDFLWRLHTRGSTPFLMTECKTYPVSKVPLIGKFCTAPKSCRLSLPRKTRPARCSQ